MTQKITYLEAFLLSDVLSASLNPSSNKNISQELKDKGDFGISTLSFNYAYMCTKNIGKLKFHVNKREELIKAEQLRITQEDGSAKLISEFNEFVKIKVDSLDDEGKIAHNTEMVELQSKVAVLNKEIEDAVILINETTIEVDLHQVDKSVYPEYSTGLYPNTALIISYCISE
jgi:hypothetical protein